MKPSEAFTSKQKDNLILSTAKVLKKLIVIPEVKDLIKQIVLASKESEKEDYVLLLTKDGLIQQRMWLECVYYDFFTSKENRYEKKIESKKITVKNIKGIVVFFDLSVEEIIVFQKKFYR